MNYLDKIKIAKTTYDIKDSDAARAADLSAETTARQEADANLQTAVNGKQAALSQAQLDAVNSGIDGTKVAQIGLNADNVELIDSKIPVQASPANQLADKAFVNSTVQTSSANFRGNWATWTAVPTDENDYPADADGSKTPTKNDYLVVQDASDFTGTTLTGTWRFKYSGDWATDGKAGWQPEYQVNETPMTAAQLAALNSGATAALMEKLEDIPADAEANVIDGITVNGTPVTPDANKIANLTIDGGVTRLTSNTNLWTLPSGYYVIASGAKYKITSADSLLTAGTDIPVVVSHPSSGFTAIEITRNIRPEVYTVTTSTGSDSSSDSFVVNSARLLRGGDTQDALTSTSSHNPLSANQGRVLNEKIVGTTETKTIATTDWTALTGADPYDFQATVTATATINASTGVVELLNDNPVDFAAHGYAIGAVSGQNITIYSIGQPDASVSLKINIRNL